MQTDTIFRALKNGLSQRMNNLDRGFVEPHMIRDIAAEVFEELGSKGLDLSDVDRDYATNRAILELLRVGPLLGPMLDPDVSEIMVNGPSTIFIERGGKRFKYGQSFSDPRELRMLVTRLVELVPGKRLDEASPMVDLALPEGSRVNIAIPPVVVGGPQLTFRKYVHQLHKLEDVVAREMLDMRMAAFLRAAVKARVNILFSGASGSGKTTLLEILAREIPDRDRLVVIEDTAELHFVQPNVVRMLTRTPNIEGYGEITTSQCFHNSLRMRPSRIILGELRGPEALDYLQALNSGHRGSLAVIHASSPGQAVTRVENLAIMSGRQVPVSVVSQQLVQGLDLVVQVEQLHDGVRKIVAISQLVDVNARGDFTLEDIFRFEATRINEHESVEGRFVATGVVPYFLDHIHLEGIQLPERIFSKDPE